MRTLEEIKNDVCLEYGYYTYSIAVSEFKQGRMGTKTFNCIVRDIAREVAKESLKNASEKINHNYFMFFERWNETLKKVSDENNIPKT